MLDFTTPGIKASAHKRSKNSVINTVYYLDDVK